MTGRDGPPGGPHPARADAMSTRFLVAESGRPLVDIRGTDEARRVPEVAEVGGTGPPGQEVVLRRSFQDRLACVIAAYRRGDAAAGRPAAVAQPAAVRPGGPR